MIPAIEIKAIGFEKLDKDLKHFKADIKTKARRAGLVEMSKPVKKTLKASIPIGLGYDNTGALRKSIGHAAVAKGDKGALGLGLDDEAIIVGSTRKVLDHSGKKRFQQYKLHWLDKGVKAHKIRARKGGFLRFGGNVAKEVGTPLSKLGESCNEHTQHIKDHSSISGRLVRREH